MDRDVLNKVVVPPRSKRDEGMFHRRPVTASPIAAKKKKKNLYSHYIRVFTH